MASVRKSKKLAKKMGWGGRIFRRGLRMADLMAAEGAHGTKEKIKVRRVFKVATKRIKWL